MVVVAKARIAKQGSFIFVGVLSIDAVAGMGIKKDWSQLQKDQERERERESEWDKQCFFCWCFVLELMLFFAKCDEGADPCSI